jgi:hypothetical protein
LNLPPPLPTRWWGRVPNLAPVVSALASQARAEFQAVRELARRARLPLHVVAQLPEIDGAEAVELTAPAQLPAAPVAVEARAAVLPSLSRPSSRPVEVGSRRPARRRSERVARPRWSAPSRAFPHALPEAVPVAARRRRIQHATKPRRPLMGERGAALPHVHVPAATPVASKPRPRPEEREHRDRAERAICSPPKRAAWAKGKGLASGVGWTCGAPPGRGERQAWAGGGRS